MRTTTQPHPLAPADVERILRSLVPPNVAVAALEIEEASRRAEFAAGRECARVALARLGQEAGDIGMEADGAPAWPAGIVGSLSHSQGLAAATVARSEDLAGLGLDLVRARPLPRGSEELFCTAPEARWLRQVPDPERDLMTLILFSAKESVQKGARYLLGRLPEAHEIELRLVAEEPVFTATVESCDRHVWRGRHAFDGAFVFTAATGLRSR